MAIIPEYEVIDLDGLRRYERPKYRPAPMFDFDKGDFVRDSFGRVKFCDGREAWRQWCLKVAMTERDTRMAYSTNIGVEMEDAQSKPTDSAVQSAIERTITEALMVHPMTESVRAFHFTNAADGGVNVTFEVTGINAVGFTVDLSYVNT